MGLDTLLGLRIVLTMAELVVTAAIWLLSYRFKGAILWTAGLGIELFVRLRMVTCSVDVGSDLLHSYLLTAGLVLRVLGIIFYLLALLDLRRELSVKPKKSATLPS